MNSTLELINPLLKKEEAQKRFNICINCDRFIKSTTMCKECLCVMKVKCKLKTAECPLGKWT
jgi:hypothetical protein